MSRPTTPGYNIRRPAINTSFTNSTGVSRTASPAITKPGISLDEWESKATLSDAQLDSIRFVKDKLGRRPLPERFNKAESSAQGASRPGTPIAPQPTRLSHLRYASPSSRPSSLPSSPAPGSSGFLAPPDPLHPTFLATPQQFHDHFIALTLTTEHEQDSLYRDHLAEIVGLREKCDGLIEALQGGEEEVGEMLKALEYVEERSESLRGACEDLLEEQTHLLTHTSQLAHRLTFFTFLETAQRTLNSPKSDLVLSEDFLPMVKRLDECLGYLGEHRDFKDAEVYLMRYQQCMTRSMTLVKIHFVNTIKALGQEVSRRVQTDKGLSETAIQALIYTKFGNLSSAIRPLLAELEHRVKASSDDLSSLLRECHFAWIGARQSLVSGRVSMEIARMEPATSALVDLTRAGCSYLKQTCLDEFNLYKQFFATGESHLYGFLESLCDNLYDHLRPRILHEPSLEILCGVCTVLQALMVQDVSSIEEEPEIISSPVSTPAYSPFATTPNGFTGDDYFSAADETYSARQRRTGSVRHNSYSGSILGRPERERMNSGKVKQRKQLGRLHTEVLLRLVLQDAQTRLVFRAQALLRAEVEFYVPKEGDLDYPAKIQGKKGRLVERPNNISLDVEDDDEPTFRSLPSEAEQDLWYPTLKQTLWILSRLYSYIDTAVFDDLAQEAITTCRRSLTSGSEVLASKGKDKEVDAKLFLVRHLLILKETTAGLDLGKKDRRGDWQGITDFLKSLLDNATSMLGYARGALVRPNDIAADARMDIDRELKRVCEELISTCTSVATLPLSAFLDKCSAYLSSRPSTSADLSAQAFATPQEVLRIHDEFKKSARTKVDEWVNDLMVYLQDEDTVKVLLPPAQNSIVDYYRQFHELVRAEYDFSTAAAIMTPSGVQTLLAKS